MGKTLKNKLSEGIARRELELSPEESKKRIEKVLYKQRILRKSINYTQADLQKITFPSYPIGH